ncbi:MAG: mannose-1-phosphate guanylyltransferase [Thermoplasmatota archaeon]
MKAVILAGGSGERFWPLSTPETPKQFLKLFGESSLIRQTLDRLLVRFAPSEVLVVTSRDQVERTSRELPEIPAENILGEPKRRNTAPACALAAVSCGPDEVLFTVPADHMILDTGSFFDSFDTALEGLGSVDGLFTFGIPPSRPETGYGYIQAGEEVLPGIFRVTRFLEKPDREKAEEFIRNGRMFWNSGMFLWKAGTFLRELERCSPDIFGHFRDLDPRDRGEMDRAYDKLPSRSVDYGVMELSDAVNMVEGKFPWSDVGSWGSILEFRGGSEESPDLILVDSKNVLVHKESPRKVAVVGVDGIIVVETGDSILVCSEKGAQSVREAARKARSDGKD